MWFGRIMALLVIGAVVALLTCMPDVSPYWLHSYADEFVGQYHYSVVPAGHTAEGISVDPSGQAVDYDDIDLQTDQVEACLRATFGDPPRIPSEQARLSQCDNPTFPLPLRRQDLVVKTPADWLTAPCPDVNGIYEQTLPTPAPEVLCQQKVVTGQEPPCPQGHCVWRAGIEENRYIIVTPDLYLYKDPLIRLVTGCNNPWAGAISSCTHR